MACTASNLYLTLKGDKTWRYNLNKMSICFMLHGWYLLSFLYLASHWERWHNISTVTEFITFLMKLILCFTACTSLLFRSWLFSFFKCWIILIYFAWWCLWGPQCYTKIWNSGFWVFILQAKYKISFWKVL